jgi:TPR repeat protein
MQPKVFICYRREDTAPWAQLIYRYSVESLGRENVFYDIDSIPPGHDFRRVIGDHLDQIDVLFVVIGRSWANIGRTKLFNENDFVRFEIRYALENAKLIAPLLVDNASMPTQDDLPKDIQELIYRNATRISPEKTYRDCRDLLDKVQSLFENKQNARLSQKIEVASTPQQPDILEQSAMLFNNKEYRKAYDLIYQYRENSILGAEIFYRLGYHHEFGFGVNKNLANAADFYSEAARKGHAEAQYKMGVFLEEGFGITQNEEWAVGWYENAAKQGHAGAQNNLGGMYYYGKGVSKNYFTAVYWYNLSAQQGNSYAQTNMGIANEFGYGTQQNYFEAFRWYQLAADQGNAQAQWGLGRFYAEGKGVVQNYFEAARWYLKAAEQNNQFAQLDIANLYEKGVGIAKDKQRAIYWNERAAQLGNKLAEINLKRLKKRRLF